MRVAKLLMIAASLVTVFHGATCYASDKGLKSKTCGDISFKCENAGDWKFALGIEEIMPGVEEISIDMTCDKAVAPREFTISMEFPQKEMYYLWNAFNEDRNQIGPDWGRPMHTHLATGLPVFTLHNGSNRNRFTLASSEVIRDLYTKIGLREEGCNILAEVTFFRMPEAPIDHYETKIRIDTRDIFWSQSVSEGVEWMTTAAGIQPVVSPSDAFEPLYSTWYQFHQNVTDSEIEAECLKAKELGIKTIIVDDGWQTDDNNRGYAYCGDWEVSKNRFPDFKSHVKKVRDMGIKYLLWYSLPLMGNKSKNYARFKDKFLYEDKDKGILDPRFPEVREFLISTFEKSMREYGLDGFKLDFIDRFNIGDNDPAITQNFADRDIKALPEAVNVLMQDIYNRLKSINPQVLIEFRQSYMGPAIRQYGNIIRAGDCPGDTRGNRQRISTLRMTSGQTAVHGDMLEWNVSETPENAARSILSSMYGVIQYSLMLRDIPESHLRMVRHWYNFLDTHRQTLLKSEFRPYNPEAGFPMLSALSDRERIFTIYLDNYMAAIPESTLPTYIINSTGNGQIYVDSGDTCEANIYDTFGDLKGKTKLQKGVNKINVPIAGYIVTNQDAD